MAYTDARYEQARREFEAEAKAYADAKRQLTPKQREAWERVVESYEYFDGEDGIALGYLQKYLREGRLR
jgi:hypothetical protein